MTNDTPRAPAEPAPTNGGQRLSPFAWFGLVLTILIFLVAFTLSKYPELKQPRESALFHFFWSDSPGNTVGMFLLAATLAAALRFLPCTFAAAKTWDNTKLRSFTLLGASGAVVLSILALVDGAYGFPLMIGACYATSFVVWNSSAC